MQHRRYLVLAAVLTGALWSTAAGAAVDPTPSCSLSAVDHGDGTATYFYDSEWDDEPRSIYVDGVERRMTDGERWTGPAPSGEYGVAYPVWDLIVPWSFISSCGGGATTTTTSTTSTSTTSTTAAPASATTAAPTTTEAPTTTAAPTTTSAPELIEQQRATPLPESPEVVEVVLGEASTPDTAPSSSTTAVEVPAGSLPVTGGEHRTAAAVGALATFLGALLVALRRWSDRRAATRLLRALPPGRGWVGLLEDVQRLD